MPLASKQRSLLWPNCRLPCCGRSPRRAMPHAVLLAACAPLKPNLQRSPASTDIIVTERAGSRHLEGERGKTLMRRQLASERCASMSGVLSWGSTFMRPGGHPFGHHLACLSLQERGGFAGDASTHLLPRQSTSEIFLEAPASARESPITSRRAGCNKNREHRLQRQYMPRACIHSCPTSASLVFG